MPLVLADHLRVVSADMCIEIREHLLVIVPARDVAAFAVDDLGHSLPPWVGAAIVGRPRCGYVAPKLQAMEATRIQLCGRLAIEIAGRRLEEKLPGRQGTLLFAYLTAKRIRPTTRAELVAVLWPDQPPPRPADTPLARVLSRLRRAPG